ncbi:MAG TPA: NAD(P)H-quinone oxidoreductase [Stellaceae bacterium]|jgi:putative PIG3 family NAD(P)H quinone oxidoreductase|nr:NAD(P)H-quinone oxidoreductase [Stellaceae bacterium]
MKAVIAKPDNSGPILVERPVPTPGHGEVVIKVAAAGINGADLSQARGRYPVPPGATDILGLEASGEITALGAGVTQWQIGDQVCALLVGGGYAEYVAVPAVQCLAVPKGLSVIEAAALPECVITVWLNVFDLGGLKPGDRLLVHGGSSGIGTTAIQIARALGSAVVITAGSAEKCRRCTELGANLAIDYNSQDYVEQIEAAFGKRSVDVALNMVGGDYVMRDIRLLTQGGRLVMIAARKGSKIEFDYQALTEKDGRMTGSRLRPRPIPEKGRLVAAVRKAVWPLIAEGKFKPVIDKTYPLDQFEAAHAHMAGSHIGKILLTM